jgi:AcrR family transcriptional regulator
LEGGGRMADKRFLNEALKLFADKGYEGTSVRDIAKKVGLTPSSVYSHFSSKEELYLEILDSCISKLVKDIDDLINEHADEEREQILYRIYRYHMEIFMSSAPTSIFILRNIMFPHDGLQDTVKGVFMEKTSGTTLRIVKIFEECFGTKETGFMEYMSDYFRFIDSFIIDNTARNRSFTSEELDRHWKEYWRQISSNC